MNGANASASSRDLHQKLTRVVRQRVALPSDIMIGPHEGEARFIGLAPAIISVVNNFERKIQRARLARENVAGIRLGAERKQRIARAELLEDIAARGKLLRREVMAGARLEGMLAMRGRLAAGRTRDHRRAFVIRLVGHEPIADAGLALLPGVLKLGAVARGVVAIEEMPVPVDAASDEILARLLEDRVALVAIGLEQRVTAPAFELRRQFPAEVAHILEAVIEAEAAIGRMAVRRVAGDEDAADLIFIRDRDAQIPKSDMVEFGGKGETRHALNEALEIVIVGRRTFRHRRVKEPTLADIDAAEELPIAFQIRM